VFRDAAFQFYYPENLEALAREGACLVEISPLVDNELPEVDALYMGGGFPETLAPGLAKNRAFLASVRGAIEKGLPVYAECGGAVFLGKKLLYEDGEYPLAGVLPVDFAFQKKPQGHGYAMLETVAGNPFYNIGDRLRGHEFHYTYMQPPADDDLSFAFRVRRGHGFDGRQDGLCRHNVLALYTHVHALGTESWAPALVRAAMGYRASGEQ
jgi:cobyrinic acid a,c-diamide synthase